MFRCKQAPRLHLSATSYFFCVGGFRYIFLSLGSNIVISSEWFVALSYKRPTPFLVVAKSVRTSTATLLGPLIAMFRINVDSGHLGLGDVLGAQDLTSDVYRMVRNRRLGYEIGEAVGHIQKCTPYSRLISPNQLHIPVVCLRSSRYSNR